ncbi:hypothetical protein LVD17_07600 [Fulvivirga ulvae]|uniref:hypothetical protein n=1 Tax=Fulvivirga ulvae TaxID=2904245 RepID=UPI001F246F4A|nr:hypothetical protein [Fulvivirga ulvae]UII33681.1 hypothetical protein LVD17_07600 [Fulvivirga ulvae]
MNVPNPIIDPLFWVNSAILLYFSGVLFLFLFFEPLAKVNEASAVISYMFHNVLLVLKNVLFAVGFWKSRSFTAINYGK